MLSRFALVLGAAAIAGACLTPAAAAPRHYRHVHAYHYYAPAVPRYVQSLPVPSLTIRKRSYLDAGVVVPVGTEQAYVADSTIIGAPYVVRDLLHNRIDSWRADKFSIPGGHPYVEFWTPGAPY